MKAESRIGVAAVSSARIIVVAVGSLMRATGSGRARIEGASESVITAYGGNCASSGTTGSLRVATVDLAFVGIENASESGVCVDARIICS